VGFSVGVFEGSVVGEGVGFTVGVGVGFNVGILVMILGSLDGWSVKTGRGLSVGAGFWLLGGLVGVTELKLSVNTGSLVGLFVSKMGLGLGVPFGTGVSSLSGCSVDKGLTVGIDEEVNDLVGEAV
jgi:hypothetical protein